MNSRTGGIPTEDQKKLTAGYYFIKMLPTGFLIIVCAAVLIGCAHLFLRLFFTITGPDPDFTNMLSGGYYNPLRAFFFLIFGLLGGTLIAFLFIAVFFILTSLLFPSKIIRAMFIGRANIARAKIIRIYEEDVKKHDERCDADVRVTPKESADFRARIKVPLKPRIPLAEGSRIFVAYSFVKNNERLIDKIMYVERSELSKHQFEKLFAPPPKSEEPDKAPDISEENVNSENSDGFEPAEFTEMEVIDGESEPIGEDAETENHDEENMSEDMGENSHDSESEA